MIESLLSGWVGQVGVIIIVAQVVDLIEKRMGKKGLFEDLANFAREAGKGIGLAIAGAIPGKKIEPELADFLEHLANAEDALSNAILEQLRKETENGENKE